MDIAADPALPATAALRRQTAYPFQSALEPELLVGDIAQHGPVSAPRDFGLGIFPAQIDHGDALSREVLQRFGEQCPCGHVRRGERIADEGDFMGRLQAGEGVRPDQPEDRLFDEAGFRQHRRDHYGLRFEVPGPLGRVPASYHRLSYLIPTIPEQVVYRELPDGSQRVRLWEMTDAQQELTVLAASLRVYGIDVRFERDSIDESGMRFLNRVNAMLGLMDAHVLDFNRFANSAAPCGVSSKS